MPIQLIERQHPLERDAVVDEVQVVGPEIDQPLAGQIGDIGVLDTPLIRNLPVIARRSGRDLAQIERSHLAQALQCLAHAIAGQAPTDREELLQQRFRLRDQPAPIQLTVGEFPDARQAILLCHSSPQPTSVCVLCRTVELISRSAGSLS